MRILSLALLLTMLAGCSKKPATAQRGPGGPVPVNIGEVVKKDMPVDLRGIGNVESINSVGIKAQVGGELIEVNFKEGQDVKRGDLLFTIQPRLYTVQLAQAEANLARDRAAAENARREANRNVELGTKGAISSGQLDQLRSNADAAEATVKADEALVEIARVRVGYTTIESPIDGRTGALKVQAGNLIKDNADNPMVTINQMAPIYVSFPVGEEFLAEIRKQQTEKKLIAVAHDPKGNQQLATGELTFIDNSVDSTTGMVMLKATFANEDRTLWPGAFVEVRLRLRTDEGVTVAPSPAVTVGQQGTQVFVIKDDGTVELRPVTVKRTIGQESIIEKGLMPGEKVVVNGQSRLIPGSKVVIKPDGARSPTVPPLAQKGSQP
jgi:membrane fusion protein, multidrug efflux system